MAKDHIYQDYYECQRAKERELSEHEMRVS